MIFKRIDKVLIRFFAQHDDGDLHRLRPVRPAAGRGAELPVVGAHAAVPARHRRAQQLREGPRARHRFSRRLVPSPRTHTRTSQEPACLTRVTVWRGRGKYLNWRTLDSARQFAAAARIGYNATATLAAMESVLSPPDDGYIMCASFAALASVASAAEAGGLLCADPSGYISDGDCVGLENAGFVAACSKRPFHAEKDLCQLN